MPLITNATITDAQSFVAAIQKARGAVPKSLADQIFVCPRPVRRSAARTGPHTRHRGGRRGR